MKSLGQADPRRERQGRVNSILAGKLPDNFVDLAAELWMACSVTGQELSPALRRVLGWRMEEAHEILTSELGQIKRRLSRVGEVVELSAMVLRYIRAAQEGTGEINLRIMAKVMRGLAARSKFQASSFLRYADAVASLTIQEIGVIATLQEKTLELEEQDIARDRDNQAWVQTVEDLVPRMIESEQTLAEIMLTASRTGLVTKAAPFKLGPFCTTPLLHDLNRLASLQRAIADQGHEY